VPVFCAGDAVAGLDVIAAVSLRPLRAERMDVLHLNCPRCRLTITPRASWLTVEHCPRCMARSHVAVRMFSSSLPASELYAAGTAPGSDPQRSMEGPEQGMRWEP